MTSSNRTLPLFYLGKIFVQTNYRIMQPTSHALCKVSQASVKGHNSKQPGGNIEQMTSYSLCEAAHTSAKGHENQANDLILCEAAHTSAKGHENQANDLILTV